jgi:hypothetical protein
VRCLARRQRLAGPAAPANAASHNSKTLIEASDGEFVRRLQVEEEEEEEEEEVVVVVEEELQHHRMCHMDCTMNCWTTGSQLNQQRTMIMSTATEAAFQLNSLQEYHKPRIKHPLHFILNAFHPYKIHRDNRSTAQLQIERKIHCKL